MNSKVEIVTSAELLPLLSSPVLGWAGRVGGVVRVAYQTTCARDHEYEGFDRDDVDDDIDRYVEIVETFETIGTSSHQAQGGGERVTLPHLGTLCPG